MDRTAIRIASTVVLALISVGEGAMVAQADTLNGVFSNVITAGFVLNTPTVGTSTFSNNSATYVVGTNTPGGASCAGANTLCWGTGTGLGIPASQQYSQLTFAGSTSFNAAPNLPSQYVGSIAYTNGTSLTGTTIFGATLSLYDNDDLLGSYSVLISTTQNQYSGLGLTTAELNTDADFINICGYESNICGDSIEAYEAGEGGTGLLVDLDGVLVGDPHIQLGGVNLDPLDAGCTTCGIVGTEVQGAVSPEPPSVVLLSTAVIAFAFFGFRSRRNSPAWSRV